MQMSNECQDNKVGHLLWTLEAIWSPFYQKKMKGEQHENDMLHRNATYMKSSESKKWKLQHLTHVPMSPNRNNLIVLSGGHAIRMYEAKIQIQRKRAD